MSGRFVNKPQESAANCIAPAAPAVEPSTPEHIKQYRKSYKQQAGVSILHHGVATDPKPNIVSFGKKTLDSDHAKDIFTNPQNQGIKELITEIKQQKYASRTREPLGARMVRNYVYPNGLDPEQDFFGNQTQGSEYTAQEVMFPPKPIVESEQTQKLYLKSHQSYEPGEQKRRNYNWPVEPAKMVFGQKEDSIPNEGAVALRQEGQQQEFPKTLIVKKKQEDFRNFKDDPLGQTKNLAQLNPNITENTVFGFRPQAPEEWDAARCIKGEANWKESQPDQDLGHTNKFGFRNVVQNGDENRVFGVPTIRSDIQPPSFKSVADPLNYGDEPKSVQLLFPDQYSTMGLDSDDFFKPREKQEIQHIFQSIGHQFKIGKFEGIYLRALQLEGSRNNNVSVKSFMQAVEELQDID